MRTIDQAREALENKHQEVCELEKKLGELRRNRQQAAIAGSDTVGLRQQAADGDALLEDLRAQEGHLVEELERATAGEFHLERLRMACAVYERDLSYLEAERELRIAQENLAKAERAVNELTEGRAYHVARGDGFQLTRYGLENDPDAPVRLESYQDEARGYEKRTVALVEYDIERIEGLIASTEARIDSESADDGETIERVNAHA